MARRDPPEGADVEKYRSAERGRIPSVRASSDFIRAARWLEAKGYHDAAVELARASRGQNSRFWTETRVQAFTLALASDTAPDWSSKEPLATGAVLANTASFLRLASFLLLLGKIERISVAHAARIRRCVALLAHAVLDATDEQWRNRRW